MRKRGPEKRREKRVRAALPVEAGAAAGLTRDVSASGIFFETDERYAIGSTIRVALDLDTPWGKVMFRGDGRIVRVEAHDHKVGVAVRFAGGVGRKTASRKRPAASGDRRIGRRRSSPPR